MKFTLEDIKGYIFSPQRSIKAVVFNLNVLIALFGVIGSIISEALARSRDMQNLLLVFELFFFIFLLWLGNKKKKIDLAAILFITVTEFLLFPLMFFTTGGMETGMPIWFLIVLISVFLLIDGKKCWILYGAGLAIFLVLVFFAYRHPEFNLVKDVPASFYLDVAETVVWGSLMLGFAIKAQKLVYTRAIDEMNKKNDALKDSELKAETANHAKSDFLSNMSHEIRTPINAVLGMNEMIIRECRDKKILEYAKAIQNSGNALLSLINDILDLSKIESGKVEIVQEEYRLADFIINTYGLVADRLEKKGLRGAIFCNENLPSGIIGDAPHLRQVLVNMLTNAIKYTQKGSVDFFILGNVKDDVLSITFSVKDTGIGIKEEDLKKIFSKFERFDLNKNRNIEGSGLGLSITKRLVELMGGKIEVKSTYGQGSEFIVTLKQKIFDMSPVGEVTPKHKTEDEEIEVYHQSFEAPDVDILAVDDVDMNLIVFENLLKETKMKIDLVDSGEKCIEKAKAKHYDMIFMDHMMPVMNGIETLLKMKSMETLNTQTPVVMLTANALAGVREEYIKAGFVDYIPKPLDGEVLEKTLVKYLPKEKVFLKTGKDDIPCGEKISRLKNILADFDYEAALGYCDDSETFCIEIISEYATNNHITELVTCFEECEWEKYKQYVHSLKSTSRTIGFLQLAEEFRIQEEAVKKCELDFARKNHKKLLEHYVRCVNVMKDCGFVSEAE